MLNNDTKLKEGHGTKLPAFHVSNLCKYYQMGETKFEAFRGVDIDISEGEWVVLLKPSGSRESSFLNILGGLDSASSGDVFLGTLI